MAAFKTYRVKLIVWVGEKFQSLKIGLIIFFLKNKKKDKEKKREDRLLRIYRERLSTQIFFFKQEP